MTIDNPEPTDKQAAAMHLIDSVNEEVEVLTEDEWRDRQEGDDDEPFVLPEPHEHTLICTCCRPARPIKSAITMEVHADPAMPFERTWLHEHDDSEALTLHAHVDHGGTDCDGPLEHHAVVRPNSTHEVVSSEYDFKSRVVRWMPKYFMPGGSLTIEDHGAYWTAPTDEGHEYQDVRWCEDPACAYADSWQRDVFAEEMGY